MFEIVDFHESYVRNKRQRCILNVLISDVFFAWKLLKKGADFWCRTTMNELPASTWYTWMGDDDFTRQCNHWLCLCVCICSFSVVHLKKREGASKKPLYHYRNDLCSLRDVHTHTHTACERIVYREQRFSPFGFFVVSYFDGFTAASIVSHMYTSSTYTDIIHSRANRQTDR